MMNDLKKQKTRVSLDALKGMQSVRATFTLPPQTISMLSAVASQLGVKQKSIFDHLVENRRILDEVADKARRHSHKKKQRRQKTFVLSKNSLSTLDAFAKAHELPRDVLVEFSIQQLRPVLAEEKERHENRKALLKEMQVFLAHGKQMAKKARSLMGEEEPAFQKLKDTLDLHEKNINELENAIEKGKCMETVQ